MSGTSRLPTEIHSSAHQVRFENSVIGEFEIRIYRGVDGPVVVVEATSRSPMPVEYLSEFAVRRFLGQIPNTYARFFERQFSGDHEVWVEVGLDGGVFFRRPCLLSDAIEAVVSDESENPGPSFPGRIQSPLVAIRRR